VKRTLIPAALALSALAACQDQPTAPLEAVGPQFSAVAITDNEMIPVAIDAFIPCANGGAGENVTFEGYLHALTHITENAVGGYVVKSHFQPQGITGTGDVTGDRYQGTGVSQEQIQVAAGENLTFINNFRMIGQGPGNNFLVHQNVHLTVNANGVLTAFVDNTTTECK
jgi:hypothetical protein